MSLSKRPAVTHIKDLTPDPRNARRHTQQNIGMISDSLRAVGAGRSIVIDEQDTVLAGNGVLEAAAEAGITKVQVVDADGETIIAVRRTGLTAEQKTKLALYDNRTAEIAEWNIDVLRDFSAEGLDLAPFEFDAGMLESITGIVAGQTDPDEVPSERATDIKPGDLFELGQHRLFCGDSTFVDGVTRLLDGAVPTCIVTDPPYGVDYSAVVESRQNQKKGGWNPIVGDALNDDALETLVRDALVLVPAPVLFVWHPSNRIEVFMRAIRSAGWKPSQQIVWVKNALVFGRADYQWRHEPCIYAKRDGAGQQDDRTATTVWEFPKPTGQDHPTSKPVGVYEIPYKNHTSLNDAVYEPFCGSGTAIIAAEQLTRRCYAVELSPSYCQVIIDRWEAFTGQKAVKVGEAALA